MHRHQLASVSTPSQTSQLSTVGCPPLPHTQPPYHPKAYRYVLLFSTVATGLNVSNANSVLF
eukprot:6198691-Pyramimonas_sp.AAC.1